MEPWESWNKETTNINIRFFLKKSIYYYLVFLSFSQMMLVAIPAVSPQLWAERDRPSSYSSSSSSFAHPPEPEPLRRGNVRGVRVQEQGGGTQGHEGQL